MPQRTNAFQRIIALLNAILSGRASIVEFAMLRDHDGNTYCRVVKVQLSQKYLSIKAVPVDM